MTPIGPGTLLAGRFRLEDLLEETGGARFWRATDLTLMRDVAVHVLDESDPRAPALLTAARRSATVAGTHLLRVLDAAAEDGVVYVVNEWGDGLSLDRMLLEGPLPPRQAAWMVREVADAISEAHGIGVAHGRLLPENVMVTDSGSVKLIGFVVDSVLHGRPDTRLSDHESDVHNLAALLYAALVGRWPGSPGSSLPVAPRDHGRVLRPRQVRAGVPKPLDRVCDTVLNPSSDVAFPIETAHEIRAALSDYLGDAGEGMPVDRSGGAAEAEPTQRIRLVGDPEATQAGIPLFDDETDDWAPRPPDSEATALQPPQPTTKSPYVGMGSGQAPYTWGPDVEAEPPPRPSEWEGDAPGSSWFRLAGLLAGALLLVVAVVVAFNLGRGDSNGTDAATPDAGRSSPADRSTVLALSAVRDFDPFQDGEPKEENPDLVPLSHDGDPGTAWTTLTYEDGPELAVYKPGVGLLVDLGQEKRVGSVTLTLVGTPTDVRLLAAPAGSAAPTGIDGLDEVATAKAAGTRVTLTPRDEVSTRYLVVWLTALPRVSDGFKGEVAEIVVRS